MGVSTLLRRADDAVQDTRETVMLTAVIAVAALVVAAAALVVVAVNR